MAENFDVVVVGGGVAGCSLAYALSSRGASTLILERDEIAGHASGVAAGLLTPSSEIEEPGPLFDFAQKALRKHQALSGRLKEQTGIDFLYAPQPVLRLAFTKEEEEAMRARLDWQDNLRWVGNSELLQIEQCANPSARGAIYCDNEARVNSRLLVKALADAAVKNGATIRKGRAVGIAKYRDRLTGLVLEDCQIVSGAAFVFATGPWAPEAGELLDLSLPIEPLRGQILVMQAEQNLRNALFLGGNYVFSQSDGSLVAGTTEEWAGFDTQVTPDGKASILKTLSAMAPALSGATIIDSRVGLRPVCLDGLPIIGQAPEWQNVFLSMGYGRKGILLGPLIGECLAALILKDPVPYPIDVFNPLRLVRAKEVAS